MIEVTGGSSVTAPQMTVEVVKPSWMRWPPNCCETCTGWAKETDWTGRCNQSSINAGDVTDARFRCQDFKRMDGI